MPLLFCRMPIHLSKWHRYSCTYRFCRPGWQTSLRELRVLSHRPANLAWLSFNLKYIMLTIPFPAWRTGMGLLRRRPYYNEYDSRFNRLCINDKITEQILPLDNVYFVSKRFYHFLMLEVIIVVRTGWNEDHFHCFNKVLRSLWHHQIHKLFLSTRIVWHVNILMLWTYRLSMMKNKNDFVVSVW